MPSISDSNVPSAMFSMLAEQTVVQPIEQSTLTYCPTMDLIAMATQEEKVVIYRLNGQRILNASQKGSALHVWKLKWKPDGQLLAVAWSDACVRLIRADNSKVIHQVGLSALSEHEISCLGWGINLTGVADERRRTPALQDFFLDDSKETEQHEISPDALLDLPRELALLDIESSLPRLSVLPSLGKDEDAFSTRASVDAMFHAAKKATDEAVAVLVIGCTDGTIHLSIFDSFEIGPFDLNRVSVVPGNSKPLLHSSHPQCSTHSLLVSSQASNGSEDNDEFSFVPLDLRFISSSGDYLYLLASKSTQLQNMLRYIKQNQVLMQHEWKSSQDLPRKFMRNVNESLQEKSHCDIVHACYHLVCTGNCFPPMREWLVEELMERGHKRWDKAITAGYENVRRLIHECLLPALERSSVLVSRLRGLSRYQGLNAAFGLSTRNLNDIFETINCLNLLAHSTMIIAGTELRQFVAFSTWLKHEIDVQSTDTSMGLVEDPEDKDFGIDHATTLEYIQGPLRRSKLQDMFEKNLDDKRQPWDLNSEGSTLYESFKKEHSTYIKGHQTEKRLPQLAELSVYLGKQCEAVFKQIAEAERRNVLFGLPIYLGQYLDPAVVDMRTDPNPNGCVTHIAFGSVQEKSLLYIFRLTIGVENGVTSSREVEVAMFEVGSSHIKDVKFVDDEHLMMISQREASSSLVRVCYDSKSGQHSPLRYIRRPEEVRHGASRSRYSMTSISDQEIDLEYSQHTFDSIFRPARLEVNGRKGRRVVCVLAEDNLHYRVYDLDSSSRDGQADFSGEGSESVSVMSEG